MITYLLVIDYDIIYDHESKIVAKIQKYFNNFGRKFVQEKIFRFISFTFTAIV